MNKAFSLAILLMEESRLTSWYGKYPIIYMGLYIPGGAEFLPSTVWLQHHGPGHDCCKDLIL